MAIARAAIDARDWPAAREALASLTLSQPSEGVCLLMAEIEEGEHADQGRVRGWLARALAAPRDPAWIADGQVFAEWAPVSPVSGRVDAFEWKAPPDRLPAERQMEIEAWAAEPDTSRTVEVKALTAVPPGEPPLPALPTEMPGASAPAEATPKAETRPEARVETRPPEAKPVAAKAVETKPAEAKPLEAKPAEAARPVPKPAEGEPFVPPAPVKPVEVRPRIVHDDLMPRAPDDPGPSNREDEDERFKVF